MKRLLQIAVGLPALVFVFVGLAWWIVPDFAGAQLGMELLSGAGLSTQIADLASFFLSMGACIFAGLTTGRRVWFYPVILLLSLAIVGRLIAWLLHGADLTVGMIAVEVVVVALLSISSRRLHPEQSHIASLKGA